ncbi:MAG: DUF2461 domain-containing protein [Bacteroidia bacterium]
MIRQETLDFLSGLSQHNEKGWFDARRSQYEAARDNLIQVVDRVIEEIATFDDTLGGVVARQSLFRINRDVRFSNNKDPYKTNMGAFVSRGGRNSPFAGYYVHIEPGKSFAGGGSYMPPADVLQKIRAHIDHEGPRLREIISDPAYVAVYGTLEGEALRTAPKGYPKDHPEIDLLRMKSFVGTRTLTDAQLTSPDLVHRLAEDFRALYPLIDFLNEAIDTN